MVNQQGLLCVVKAMVGFALLAVALPLPLSAQTDLSARVPVTSDAEGFGDVLLVQEPGADTVYVFGLTGAVPPQSSVSITVGEQVFTVAASVVGQFPIRTDNVVGITVDDASDIASVTATLPDGTTISGTFPLGIQSTAVVDALNDRSVSPNILLDIVPDDAANAGRVGQVLLTQELITFDSGGGGPVGTIVDVFEGIGNAADGSSLALPSVPPFSLIEVYQGNVDRVSPNPAALIQVLRTDTITPGREFVSNGSFFPFTVPNQQSGTAPEDAVVSLRITNLQDSGDVFWATITNDIDVSVTVSEVTQDVNGSAVSVINGTADPYSVLTVLASDAADAAVLAQGQAGADGSFSISVPPIFDEDGFPLTQENVFITATDPFGNTIPAPIQVNIDDGTPDPTVDTLEAAGTNILITGTAEARASLQIFFVAASTESPIENPVAVAELPAGGFQYSQTSIEADGSYAIQIPNGLTDIVYLRAIDANGNSSLFVPADLRPLNTGLGLSLVQFQTPFTSITNNLPGQPDQVSGIITLADGTPVGSEIEITVDSGGNPLFEPVRKVVFVTTFLRAITEPGAFPFANELSSPRVVPGDDGSYTVSVRERDRLGSEFIEDFWLVAVGFNVNADGSIDQSNLEVLGATFVDESSTDTGGDGFDRVGPQILLAPLAEDISLAEKGSGASDIMNIGRIFPSDLPADALPFVVILANSDDNGSLDASTTINVNDPNVEVVGFKALNSVSGLSFGIPVFPIPGVTGIELGDNSWNALTQTVTGRSVVFVSLIDSVGNFSPNPIPVQLDVFTQDPNTSSLEATGTFVLGDTGTVEEDAIVTLYENADGSGRIASIQANSVGAFLFSGLSIEGDTVYLSSTDSAGNTSNIISVPVSNPVTPPQFLILDGFGGLHSNTRTVSSGFSSTDSARAMAGVADPSNPALLESGSALYVLESDGTINLISSQGSEPLLNEEISVPGAFAVDLEVINSSPFAGYALLGNGVVVPFGDAPFLGDIASQGAYTPYFFLSSTGEVFSVDPATEPFSTTETPLDPDTLTGPVPRLRIPGSQVLFDDLNRNGIYDNEDLNGNGILDVVVGVDPNNPILFNEDANNNGTLDIEPIIDPSNLAQGFFSNNAVDLEIVQSPSGDVLGYVILDAFGVLWPFGSGYGEEVVSGDLPTNGFSTEPIFNDLELVVEVSGDTATVVDFVTLNGFGEVFGLPGGPLGAGASDDEENRGILTGALGAPTYVMDIARAIRLSPFDSNGDQALTGADGFYVLDGLGGITAIGGATPITDTPFLGLDIAKDFEFVSQ